MYIFFYKSNIQFIILQFRREIQTLQQENYSLEKQLHTFQQGSGSINNNNQPQGPRTKSFDNPSASSSTASSGVGTSISSINNNQSGNLAGAGPTNQSNVAKKYFEQKYGGNSTSTQNATGQSLNNLNNNMSSSNLGGITSGLTNLLPKNGATKTGSGIFGALNSNPNSNLNNIGIGSETDSPLGGSLSSITSQLTNGFANLKLTATNFQANKLTSKLLNPFS